MVKTLSVLYKGYSTRGDIKISRNLREKMTYGVYLNRLFYDLDDDNKWTWTHASSAHFESEIMSKTAKYFFIHKNMCI